MGKFPIVGFGSHFMCQIYSANAYHFTDQGYHKIITDQGYYRPGLLILFSCINNHTGEKY